MISVGVMWIAKYNNMLLLDNIISISVLNTFAINDSAGMCISHCISRSVNIEHIQDLWLKRYP